MKALTTLVVVGMFLTTVATADDVDDVRAVELSIHTALNAGDANAVVQHYLPERTIFQGGTLLRRFDSLEEQRNDLQARFDAGIKYNRQLRHLEVRIFGNLTALTTGYVLGTVTQPDGTVNQARVQRTAILIKQGGQWKQAHYHLSLLNIAPPQ